jgi:NADH-ubiquinone oxidoreductase chain 2
VTGSIVLVSSTNFITLFLAIELQSFAVYVLSGLYKSSHSAISASLKYFLIGALSSTLILLGSALIYGSTGLIYFNDLFYLNLGE